MEGVVVEKSFNAGKALEAVVGIDLHSDHLALKELQEIIKELSPLYS